MSNKKLSPEEIKGIDSLRHSWHESVAKDPSLNRNASAQRVATYVRQKFRSALGYAEFSLSGGARDLNMPRRSFARAIRKLLELGWLIVFESRRDQTRGWCANRYTLGGGPEDLDLAAHVPE